LSRDDRRRGAHRGSLPAGDVWHHAGGVASLVWGCRCDRRGILGEGRAAHGRFVYGAWIDRVVQPIRMGQLVYGRWIWRPSDRLWNRDRKEVRWLGTTKRKHTQSRRPRVRGRRKAGRRISID